MKRLLAIVWVAFWYFSLNYVSATHIVGAELYYECVNPATNLYDVTLKLYRDCENGQAPYDNIIHLFIFEGATGNLVQTNIVPVPINTPEIQPETWDECIATPPSICVEEGIYVTQMTLPPLAGGYDIGWARCCRNIAITNLTVPLEEGVTFLAHVPDSALATCNNMPIFDQVPPVFLCNNLPFNFDHSATDIDGDSLVYKLVDPFTGTNIMGLGAENPMVPGGNQPVVDPTTNPMGPPPYNNVQFAPGFSFTDPFGSGNFVIDPQTGFINVTPNQVGIFVFAIAVCEFRNGVLLSENRRDFQIHVLDCLPQGFPPTITHDLSGLNSSNDTIFVDANMPFCYDVTIIDSIPTDTVVAYTVSAAFGNGTFFPPPANFTFSGINPVVGQVCWTPSCNYDGQVVPLIIGGNDIADCENIADVFDTVWVVITAPPNQPPVITPDYTGLTLNGDTIVVNAQDSLCYTFVLSDADSADLLNVMPISPIFSAPDGPSFTTSGTNPILGEICWEPGCNYEGQVIELVVAGSDINPCNASLSTQTSIFIQVEVPPNGPPGISTNLSGNIFSNDTIYVNAEDSLCFSFLGIDPDVGDILSPITLSPIFSAPDGPTTTFTGTNPLSGQICWVPGCNYEGQVVELIFGVEDPGVCSNIGEAFDTVYISIDVPPNDGPVIISDLSGNTFSNDTIFVAANDNFCYTFTANDVNPQDILTAFTASPIFSGPNPPAFSFLPGNPLTGQVCWTPDCDLVNQVVELIIGVEDNGICSSKKDAFDTVYISIFLPPNDPPTIIHDLNGLDFDGDTIFAEAAQAFCFDLTFDDINVQDTLFAFTVSPIFTGPNPPVFTYTGVNPLSGQICWTPECANEGQLIEMIIRVEDNGDCNNILEAFDTVYVKVSDPLTLPPNVGHDLTGAPHTGDTIYIEIGDGACYNFYIADLTTDNGVSYEFDFEDIFGNTLNLGSVTVAYQNDSILGEVCFISDCSNGGSVYRSIITGIDKETCPPFQESKDTVYIKVNTDFHSYAGADTFFCEGSGGVQLNVIPIGGEAPYFYLWGCDNPGNCGFSSPYVQNPIVNPTDTTRYFVQITDKNGCTSEYDDIVVAVNKLPIVDAGPDVVICEGGTGTGLFCTIVNPQEAPGPYTYTWIPPDGLNNPHVPNPHANPDSTTIYTAIATSANGCTSINTTLDTLSTLIVSVQERPVVDAGPDADMCKGDTVQMVGFAYEAGPDYTYAWTPSVNMNDSSSNIPLVSPPLTTTYFFVAWSNGCPSVADSATIHVHTIPTTDPGIGYETCGNDSVRLDGLAGGDSTASYTYSWTPAIGLDDPLSATPMASPSATTTYSFLATSSHGCGSAETDITVHVLPTPIANAGLDATLCRGDTLQLSGSHIMLGGLPPTNPVFYSWIPNDGISGLFIPDPYASPEQTIVYTLEISSGSCSSTDDVKIDVFDAIVAHAAADTNRICEGESVMLSAGVDRGNGSFIWTPSLGLDDPTSSNPMASPITTTTYQVTVSEGGCEDVAEVEVVVNPLPSGDYFATKEESCEELTVSFLENFQHANSYIWQFGDESAISNEPNPTHVYPNPGTYPVSLTVVGVGGCSIKVKQNPIIVSPRAMADFLTEPSIPAEIPLPNAAVQFSNLSTNGVSFFWDFGDGNVSTDENPLHNYQESGSYTVTLTVLDEQGCPAQIEYQPIVVIDPSLFIPNVFSPNSDGVNDLFQVKYDGKEAVSVEIFDRWGRTVYTAVSHLQPWNGVTDKGNAAHEGVYYYVIKVGERFFKGNLTLLR